MRVLHKGLAGDDVSAWEYFLRGTNKNSKIVVGGEFEEATLLETIEFQKKNKVSPADGIVETKTLVAAMMLGFNPLITDLSKLSQAVSQTPDAVKRSSAWPSKPADLKFLTGDERNDLFGKFAYVAKPLASNPENIVITDGWKKENIVAISIPELVDIKGGGNGVVEFHKLVAGQIKALFATWKKLGLIDRVLTFDGSYVSRFIRGSRTTLSPHAHGTAFDINVKWNALGTAGALYGETGCIRELIESAYEHGIGNGLHYKGRIDAMHFECVKIK
jgi:hypothetical protein